MGCGKGSVNSMVNIKQWLGVVVSLSFAGYVQAEAITAVDLVQAQAKTVFMPAAERFVNQSTALQTASEALCQQPSATQLQQTRLRWQDAATAWFRLGGVQAGPVLQRKSARQVFFHPTRPARIEAAIVGEEDGESVAARGLPAVEYLLWQDGDTLATLKQSARCAYLVRITQDVVTEAKAIQQQWQQEASRSYSESDALARLNETFNVTLAAVDGLDKKLDKALHSGQKSAEGVRSGSSRILWEAQAEAINALVGVPLGKGLAGWVTWQDQFTVARELVSRSQDVCHVLHTLNRQRTPKEGLQAAKDKLAALRSYLDDQVARAVNASVSFNDADGD